MDLAGLSMPVVFLAGVVSFLSPCVLPLVPGYLAAVSGVSLDPEAPRSPHATRRAATATALFFAGFLLVFVALGASASLVGVLLDEHRSLLDRLAGTLIVVFGLAMLGIGWSGALNSRATARVQAMARRRGGPLAIGVAFAFCWTPCVGPILASVLVLAGSTASLASGVALLGVYGLGLAVPFVLIGLSFTGLLARARRLHRHYRVLQGVAGALLVVMGLLLLTDQLYVINVWGQRAMTAAGIDWWTVL